MEQGILLTTLPSREDARRLARMLVEEKLAACAQLLPIESFYRWEGAVQNEAEVLLLVKTRTSLFDNAIAAIKAAHPYSVPQIVGWPFSAGHGPYLDWIDASTRPQ
jgi:periplasmic divalent cation tolerance protein